MKPHHIGYLVKKLDKAIADFIALGYDIGNKFYDESRKVDFCFVTNNGYCVELVCPHTDSTIFPLLTKYKNSPYHMCYIVDNIEVAIENLSDNFSMFLPPQPAPAISNTAKVAFLMSANSGMVELVQQ